MTMLKFQEGLAVDQLESHLAVGLEDVVIRSRSEDFHSGVLDLLRRTQHGRACIHDRCALGIVSTICTPRIEEATKLLASVLGTNPADEAEEYGPGRDGS